MSSSASRILSLALLTGLAASLQATDLFEITVQSPTASVTSSDSSLLNLLDRAINSEGEFAIFTGTARATTLRYAGIPDALRVTLNASETSALLEIPITGFSRTFSGTDSDDLDNQIEDFLKQEGARELARFYRESGPTGLRSGEVTRPQGRSCGTIRSSCSSSTSNPPSVQTT